MMTGLHFLLTYKCLYECDHCFLYCGPRSEGTFTVAQLADALQQGVDAGIDHIFLEGGEPFLYYPLMLEALRLAQGHGLEAGIVTNCYWATSEADAALWLRPLVETGAVSNLSVSDDAFHGCDPSDSPARRAAAAAAKLGLPAGAICIDPPTVQPVSSQAEDGAVVGGGVMFRGRAADTLTADLPRRHFSCFDACPHEELVDPGRLHLDAFGNLFVCQGICIGNIWKKQLAEILAEYRPAEHPVVGPLLAGGPAALAEKYGLPAGDQYVDHCHLCFLVRRNMVDDLPLYLCPKGAYGDPK